jgi:uncharacterized protein with GYD domain
VPKYVSMFNFKGEALKAMMDKPADRAAVVRELAESAGGILDAYYFTLGQYDGLAIWEVPDSASAAAICVRVTSSGAFSHFETHELLPADQINPILQKAGQLTYRPPGTRSTMSGP